MKTVANVAITDRAAAIFQREMETRRPGSREVIALHFMSSFTNVDGTTVDEFLPGYTVDYVADRASLAQGPTAGRHVVPLYPEV